MAPQHHDTPSEPDQGTVVNVLLAVATSSLLGLVVCAVGWFLASRSEVNIDDLTTQQRRLLVRELLESSPSVYRWAFFEPRIGYTLRPNARLEAWDDTFSTNALGYRSGPPEKVPGTFRIVFVGDSWTYGMGVRGEESFPNVLADLANAHAGATRPVEAWTLALPGYNLDNSLTALDFFFDRLKPDAVVIVPSGNDNFSSYGVLSNGNLWAGSTELDRFGDPHAAFYRARRLDSHRFHDRWRQAFERLGHTEQRLLDRGLPVLHLFLARFEPTDVHARVMDAGLQAPYVIVPVELTLGRWELPAPLLHGTPEAQRLYARLVYRSLGPRLGWAPLPTDDTLDPFLEDIPVFEEGPPEGVDWHGRLDTALAEATAQAIPRVFEPSEDSKAQVVGSLDLSTGAMGRAATVLIRPRPGDRQVVVTVRPSPPHPHLYPLELTASIPTVSGTQSTTVTIDPAPSDGPPTDHVQTLTLEIPQDAHVRTALDIVLVASQTAVHPDRMAAQSVIIERIESNPSSD